MKPLLLSDYPKLLADFDKRLIEADITKANHSGLCNLMKEWYGITPIVDELGYQARFTLSDTADSTLFLLKWS
jgi:hypothetical protein